MLTRTGDLIFVVFDSAEVSGLGLCSLESAAFHHPYSKVYALFPGNLFEKSQKLRSNSKPGKKCLAVELLLVEPLLRMAQREFEKIFQVNSFFSFLPENKQNLAMSSSESDRHGRS